MIDRILGSSRSMRRSEIVDRRSEVSFLDSIHLDNCVTGANAMASSEAGREALPAFDRTKRSRNCTDAIPGNSGCQSVAGASVSLIETLRGPVRLSRY